MKKLVLLLLTVFMYIGVGAVEAKADTETICQTSNGYIEINNTTGALTSYTYGGPSGMFSNPISLDDAIDLCMQNEAAGVVYDSARLEYWTELITSMAKVEKSTVELTTENPASEAQLAQLNVLLTPTLYVAPKAGGKLTSKCTSTDSYLGHTYDVMYGDGSGKLYIRTYNSNTGSVTMNECDIITAMRICGMGNK